MNTAPAILRTKIEELLKVLEGKRFLAVIDSSATRQIAAAHLRTAGLSALDGDTFVVWEVR